MGVPPVALSYLTVAVSVVVLVVVISMVRAVIPILVGVPRAFMLFVSSVITVRYLWFPIVEVPLRAVIGSVVVVEVPAVAGVPPVFGVGVLGARRLLSFMAFIVTLLPLRAGGFCA